MPLFMDVHNSPRGRRPRTWPKLIRPTSGHRRSTGVRYLNYWADPGAGKVFCLVEAPDAATAHTVHREAHGLVADEIYPVIQG